MYIYTVIEYKLTKDDYNQFFFKEIFPWICQEQTNSKNKLTAGEIKYHIRTAGFIKIQHSIIKKNHVQNNNNNKSFYSYLKVCIIKTAAKRK